MNAVDPVARVLERLRGVKATRDGWMTLCPGHDDHTASLSVSRGDEGRVLLRCFTGCDINAILAGAGLTMQDLFVRSNGNGHGPRSIVATFDYLDEHAAFVSQTVRYPNKPDGKKDFRQRRPDGSGGWIWNLDKTRRVLYHLNELAGQAILYKPEGEKDADRLRSLGLVATTNSGGADGWRTEYAAQLTAAGCTTVIVLPDNDGPGEKHGREVAADCRAAGLIVKVVRLPDLPPKGDVSDWLDAGHSKEELLAIVAETSVNTDASEPATVPRAPEIVADLGLDLTRLTDAHGAEILAERSGGALRYDQQQVVWRRWDGTSWPLDHAGARQAAVVALAREIARYALTLDDLDLRKKVIGFALRLESRHGTDNCLELAKHHQPIAVSSDAWDRDPYLLNTPTASVDLHTAQARPARPEDLCQLATNATFDPQATAPRWLQYLDEVFPGDAALIAYLQRWTGYVLTGDVREQIFLLLLGIGANGKSVLLAILNYILGTYSYVAPFSTFIHQRQDGGNIASPELAALAGKRMISASESCEAARLDEGRIKSLTGGDTITARHLFGKHFSFEPVGKIILAANHRPRVTDDSLAFWRRCHVVPFSQSFTGAAADLTLIDQLRAEASGILNWMLSGCLAWQREGLQPPATVQVASNAYRAANDPLAGFLADCTDPNAGFDDTVLVRDALAAYRRWAEREGLGEHDRLRPKAFSDRLCERFAPFHHRTGSAVRNLKLVTL